MSQGSPYGSSPNPYSPPQGGWSPSSEQWGQSYTPDVPIFCNIVFAISLVLCLLRAGIVVLGFFGLRITPSSDPLFASGLLEVGTGVGIVLCGLPGNGLLMAKNQIGIYLGWGLVAFTIGNMLAGLLTVIIMANKPGGFGPAPPPGMESFQFAVMLIAGGIGIAIRVGIVATYIFALLQFQKWHAQYGQGSSGSL